MFQGINFLFEVFFFKLYAMFKENIKGLLLKYFWDNFIFEPHLKALSIDDPRVIFRPAQLASIIQLKHSPVTKQVL